MARLGEMLVEAGLIKPQALEDALALQPETGLRIGAQLALMGAISEKVLLPNLAQQLQVEMYDPERLEKRLGPQAVERAASDDRLSPAFLKESRCVPAAITDSAIHVAMRDPLDHQTLEAIGFATGLEVAPMLASASLIEEILEARHGKGATGMGRILEGLDEVGGASLGEETVERLKDLASEAPVVRLVSLLINNAVDEQASDIHFEPFEDRFTVRYRIDGTLVDVESPPKKLQNAILSRLKLMAGLNIAERRLPQDGRIQMPIHGREIDFRVSTVPTAYGESLVMRILDRANLSVDLDKLGFPKGVLAKFNELIQRPHGILLVTGPTGSGKTTTLYGALEKINSVERKIITVEDPVEYLLRGVNQIQINPKIGLNFASGLRSIVRQDPDVILVGEIRDYETAEIAVQSALTGHMVFSTLHTNDAPTAVGRLLEMGVEDYLIASSLVGVLAQRLVRLLCETCKRETVSDEVEGKVFEPVGCDACRNTGYKGRRPIFEIMPLSDALRKAILGKSDSGALMSIARKEGMHPLREDGLRLVAEGKTSMSELIRVTGGRMAEEI